MKKTTSAAAVTATVAAVAAGPVSAVWYPAAAIPAAPLPGCEAARTGRAPASVGMDITYLASVVYVVPLLHVLLGCSCSFNHGFN